MSKATTAIAPYKKPGLLSRIFSRNRDRSIPSRPARGIQAKPSPMFDRYSLHPGHKLTLRRLIASYDLAEAGMPEDQCDVFEDRIEADAHMRHLLENRRDAVAMKEFVVAPGGPSEADRKAAELLDAAIRKIPDLVMSLQHQAEFNWWGWAASEIVWELVDGLAVPTRLIDVPARRFGFDDFDRLLLRNDNGIGDSGAIAGEPLRPSKWWITCRSHRVTAKSGLLRSGCMYSILKSYALRDWQVFSDRYGLPYVTGTYESGFPDEEKAILEGAVKSIGSDGWAVFNDLAKITITETARTGSAEEVHGALCNYLDSQNSKLIAGATLQSDSGSSGSYGLGNVHQLRGFALIKGDAHRLEHSFAADIGRPFVAFNNLDAAPPRLKIHVAPEMDALKWADLFKKAQEIGLEVDEQQARQELKLKPPTGEPLRPPKTEAENEQTEQPGDPDEPDADGPN